jgi:hypothetical protein
MRYIDRRSSKDFKFCCQFHDWRRLSADALAQLILAARRRAVHEHLSPAEWHELDLMRRRHARLREVVR